MTFWYELASTYTYLSVMRIDEMAQARGVDVTWRPVPLGPIFAAQGFNTSPFAVIEAKGTYMWRDLARLCAARGLPFTRPAVFPQNSIHALRVSLAANETPLGKSFIKALFAKHLGEGADIGQNAVIEAALAAAGLPETLMDAAGDPIYKDALKASSAEAVSLGIFGAPSFSVGSEIFWGDDRLEAALDWATSKNSKTVRRK